MSFYDKPQENADLRPDSSELLDVVSEYVKKEPFLTSDEISIMEAYNFMLDLLDPLN